MVSSLDSSATARPTDAAAARPDDTTQHDQRFDVALKKAKSDRSGADRHRHSKPDEITHALKPGETLWSIAKQYRAPFSEVVRANRQFRNPRHIAPGKAVHIPHPDPRVVSTRQAVANATGRTTGCPPFKGRPATQTRRQGSARQFPSSCRRPRRKPTVNGRTFSIPSKLKSATPGAARPSG
jgi:LysM repeat protein